MTHRFAIFAGVGALVTIGLPFYFVSQLGLGTYAKSPQTVELKKGEKALIAGGRAKLWFAGGNTGTDIQISCAKDGYYTQAAKGEKLQACGVSVTMLEVAENKSAKFKIEWPEKPKN